MTWDGSEVTDVVLCDVVSWVVPAYKVSRVNWNYVAIRVLSGRFHVCRLVNLFMFLGNWDILTLLVMADIVFFIVVTMCGVNAIYGVIFLLVMDLVVCIYVMYL